MKTLIFKRNHDHNVLCKVKSVCGKYKIVKYSNKDYYAYFKPDGWSNFGNSCEKDMFNKSISYKTLNEAKAACIRFETRFKGNYNEHNFIRS